MNKEDTINIYQLVSKLKHMFVADDAATRALEAYKRGELPYDEFEMNNEVVDMLWRELKESDFYDKVKNILPDIGYTSNTLFEPVIFAERFIGEKKWNCISNIFSEEEKEDIISRLDDR